MEAINFVVFNVVNYGIENKIISSDYIKKIRDDVYYHCNKLPFIATKKFRINCLKKLFYFIKRISDLTLHYFGENKNKQKKFIYESIYDNILSRGANYLRMDSLYVLKRELNIFRNIDSNLEGKFFKIIILIKFRTCCLLF